MRTIIDIEKEKLQALTVLAQDYHISRAALIRKAIDTLLEQSLTQKKTEDVFGILKGGREIDGLALQKRLRSEWGNE
jgi:metal-responsive CopG/Arc/MetJ family transcriptional regulator